MRVNYNITNDLYSKKARARLKLIELSWLLIHNSYLFSVCIWLICSQSPRKKLLGNGPLFESLLTLGFNMIVLEFIELEMSYVYVICGN